MWEDRVCQLSSSGSYCWCTWPQDSFLIYNAPPRSAKGSLLLRHLRPLLFIILPQLPLITDCRTLTRNTLVARFFILVWSLGGESWLECVLYQACTAPTFIHIVNTLNPTGLQRTQSHKCTCYTNCSFHHSVIVSLCVVPVRYTAHSQESL